MNDCIEVTRRIDDKGYGRIQRRQKELKAHRVSWEQTFGPIPEGLCVLHKCDNRKCVNPDHLWLGTRSDNNKDRMLKGRSRPRRGSTNGMAGISEQTAVRVKMLRGVVTQQLLADALGMSQGSIAKVSLGRTWKHLSAKTSFSF